MGTFVATSNVVEPVDVNGSTLLSSTGGRHSGANLLTCTHAQPPHRRLVLCALGFHTLNVLKFACARQTRLGRTQLTWSNGDKVSLEPIGSRVDAVEEGKVQEMKERAPSVQRIDPQSGGIPDTHYCSSVGFLKWQSHELDMLAARWNAAK